MSFTDDQKTNIILTAAIIAGKGATDEEVKNETARLARMVSASSLTHGAFYEAEKQAENTEKTKVFTGTLLHLDQETTSKRFVLVLKTQPSKFNELGQEIVRTDIDGGDGSQARIIAQNAAQMLGHKVTVSVAIENTNNGTKVRVLRGIESRGVDTEYQANPVPVQWPQLRIDTNKLQTFQTAPAFA